MSDAIDKQTKLTVESACADAPREPVVARRLALMLVGLGFWLLVVWPVSPASGRPLWGDIGVGVLAAGFTALVMRESSSDASPACWTHPLLLGRGLSGGVLLLRGKGQYRRRVPCPAPPDAHSTGYRESQDQRFAPHRRGPCSQTPSRSRPARSASTSARTAPSTCIGST